MYNSKKQTKNHDDGETILNVQVYLNSYETRLGVGHTHNHIIIIITPRENVHPVHN